MANSRGFTKEVELTPSQREAIRSLEGNPGFDALKAAVEDMIQALSFDLMIGAQNDAEVLGKLREDRGAYQLWRTILNLVEGTYEKISEN